MDRCTLKKEPLLDLKQFGHIRTANANDKSNHVSL